MKLYYLLLPLIFLFFSFGIYAQIGFFEIYPLEVVGSSFSSVQTIDDKLYVYGTSIDTSIANIWGVQLLELDTFGQLNKKLFYTDTLDDHMVVNGIVVGGLLSKSDNGKLFCTGTFWGSGRNLYVLKADTTLNWYQLYEHADSSVAFDNPYHISAFEDGFVVSGTRRVLGQTGNHRFIQVLTNEFNLILNEHIVTQNSISTVRSAYIHKGRVISGSSIAYTGSTPADAIRYSEIHKLNLNGDVFDFWQSEIGFEAGIQLMTLAPDDGFIYSTMDVDYLPDNIFSLYPRLIRRDSTYQKLWEVELPVSGSDQNRVMGITRSLDGNWLVTAKLYTELAGSPGSPRMAPCVFKISDEGEILWSTCVTFPYEWVNNQYPSFRVGNVIQISSGSMYVVGSVNRSNPSRTLGWMLKLDKDGCLNENPCHPPPDTSVSVSNPNLLSTNKEGKLDIHPNPTTSTATVQIPGPGRLALYDLQGRLLRQEAIPAYQLDSPTAHELQINTNTLPAGMYMLVFYGDDGFVYRGKLGVVP